MRRMLFTDLRTLVADVGAQRTQLLCQRRDATHPAAGHRADVRTFSAQSHAPFHQLHVGRMLHPDHIIGALITYLGATNTGGDTVFPFRCQGSLILMHGVPLHVSGLVMSDNGERDLQVSLISLAHPQREFEDYIFDRQTLVTFRRESSMTTADLPLPHRHSTIQTRPGRISRLSVHSLFLRQRRDKTKKGGRLREESILGTSPSINSLVSGSDHHSKSRDRWGRDLLP